MYIMILHHMLEIFHNIDHLKKYSITLSVPTSLFIEGMLIK